ncbi:MAG TPA: YceI family protein [Acidimicrobiia bacterium]|nr:YceI family protein [Acidimicrobiia bacterium]
MRRLWKILIGVGVVLVVLAGLAVGGWYFFLKSDPEPPAKITKTTTVGGGTLDGTYRVAPGDPNSFVGYRAQEELAAVGFESTATGRTDEINGSFTIDGMTVKNVSVDASLLSLKSDRDMRDNRIKTLGLESEKFPQSKFVLTEPISFQSVPQAGQTVRATAKGNFTLHGVTRRVSIPLEGRWDGRDIQVVGSLDIRFADYQIEAPNIAGFVSVKDQGVMEFQIFFRKT